jgi:hypothetical protein
VKNRDIADKVRASLEDDGRITCATMHRIARELGVDPIEVGRTATELDIHASQCQLGLFGHAPRGQGKGRIIHSSVDVSEELADRVRTSLVDGQLPCVAAWEIASEFKLKRFDLGNAADALGLPISPCQLGFF